MSNVRTKSYFEPATNYLVTEIPNNNPEKRQLAKCLVGEKLGHIEVTELIFRIRSSNVGMIVYQGESLSLKSLLSCLNANSAVCNFTLSSSDGLDLLVKPVEDIEQSFESQLDVEWIGVER